MKERTATAHVRAFSQCIEVRFPWFGSEYEINRAVSTTAKRLSEIACDEINVEADTVCAILGSCRGFGLSASRILPRSRARTDRPKYSQMTPL